MSELPQIPESIAGQFVGVHAGRLIVAGGTLWTKPKWEGGEKRWTPAIYTLGVGEVEWRRSGEQIEVLAYGGAVSTSSGLVCIAGQGPDGASGSVHVLSWDGSQVRSRRIAELPEPCMALAAAPCGNSIMALGGQASPAANTASAAVWQLDAVDGAWDKGRWRAVPPIPGAGRILPSAAGFRDSIFVAGGAALSPNDGGGAARSYLRDAFRFSPGSGWTALPALPKPAVAAPAYCDQRGRFLIFGGDDGALAASAATLGASHPGFERIILRMDGSQWREAGRMPEGLVTSGAAGWQGAVVIPGGENRPGARTTRVLAIRGLDS